MDKMSKILLLINLLHHRRSVKPSEIKRVCGISSRSLYRYLNTISAGYFPVIFDRSLGGYRLLEKSGNSIDKLNLDEVVTISLALQSLSKTLNESYQKKIEAILGKLFSSQGMSIEEIWQVFREKIRTMDGEKDHSNILTELIIQTAIFLGKNLDIHLESENTEPIKITIDSPLLVFDNVWAISDRNTEIQPSIPMASVKSAHITSVLRHKSLDIRI